VHSVTNGSARSLFPKQALANPFLAAATYSGVVQSGFFHAALHPYNNPERFPFCKPVYKVGQAYQTPTKFHVLSVNSAANRAPKIQPLRHTPPSPGPSNEGCQTLPAYQPHSRPGSLRACAECQTGAHRACGKVYVTTRHRPSRSRVPGSPANPVHSFFPPTASSSPTAMDRTRSRLASRNILIKSRT
jgi:hypothetical protein